MNGIQLNKIVLNNYCRYDLRSGCVKGKADPVACAKCVGDGIEGALCEIIHDIQCLLYNVDDESWHVLREFLVQRDDDFLRLIEALPDYDALAIDEEEFRNEGDILLGDGI